jgi:hypothetical protein
MAETSYARIYSTSTVGRAAAVPMMNSEEIILNLTKKRK